MFKNNNGTFKPKKIGKYKMLKNNFGRPLKP
jgi:hypothetical protein